MLSTWNIVVVFQLILKRILKNCRHLVKYVEGEDKHPNVDIENTKLIQQFIYNKDDIDKIEKNHK